ncbi:hypothetical protein BST61_g350 [Cercospora zeina]
MAPSEVRGTMLFEANPVRYGAAILFGRKVLRGSYTKLIIAAALTCAISALYIITSRALSQMEGNQKGITIASQTAKQKRSLNKVRRRVVNHLDRRRAAQPNINRRFVQR